MFETAGTLTIVELVSSLVALVLLPLGGALVAAVAAVRRSQGTIAQRVAIATSGGAFGLAVAHAYRAAQMPPGRVAQQTVAQLARIGQLDLSIDLIRGPTSAACAVLVTFVAFAAVLHSVWTLAAKRIASRLAWTGLATSATLLVVLADGLPALAVGLQVATLAGWAIAGGERSRPLGLALAGDTAVVFAAWILFWSLGGTFGTSGYTPDPQPRFALVNVPPAEPAHPEAPGAKATVSLTTYAGARVSSDDGPPLPGEPLRSPFTLSLDPGTYSFRIEAGAATAELLVTHVTLAAGRAYVLAPYGPTTSFRNLDDQLAVPRPSAAGPSSVRAVLASRTIAGLHAPSVFVLVVVLAVLLRLALLARSERGGLAYALESAPPVILALHVVPVVDAGAAAMLAVVPAFAAAVLAGDAAGSRSRERIPRGVLASLTALAVAAVLLGETGGAVVMLVAATLGAAATTAAVDSDADVRWLGVTCAGLAGVLPAAGASPGIASAIAGAFGASAAGRPAGALVAPLATVAVILVSLAAFRMYGDAMRRMRPLPAARASVAEAELQAGREQGRAPRVLVIALAVASLLGGAALGAGTSPFGGGVPPLARRLVRGAGGVDGAPRIAIAACALSVAAAAIGLVAARRATRTSEIPSWTAALGAPAHGLGRLAALGSHLVRFFVRSVLIMNEDVIDDVTEVVAGAFAALGRGLARVERALAGGRISRALGRGADGAVAATGTDDPRSFERFKLGLIVGMVALLGLVVLSSVVLG